MHGSAFAPLKPAVVLAVVAHPDDIEFGMAGTIASFIAGGAEAYYLVLTDASKGTSDHTLSPQAVTKIRRDEQRKAAKVLGVKDVFFCDYEDGLLESNADVKREIVRVIRKVKPDVVITMDPTSVYSTRLGILNHTDHRAAGQATLDAIYPLARDHLAFPELHKEEKLKPHKVMTILLDGLDASNFYVDITPFIDKKLAALGEYRSQFGDMEQIFSTVRSWGKESGEQIGVKYAEAFTRLDLSF